MNSKIDVTVCGLSAIVFLACGGGATPPAENPQGGATTAGGATFQSQAADGQKLFADNCASCHGASGEGGKAPRLVGVSQGALPLDPPSTAKYRKTQFKTAADVAAFVTKAMPPDNPGGLKEDQYWAILAFDLKANGIDLGDKKLDATSAASVVLHP